jgi:pyrroline-5-carboxylate reductase
MTTDPRIGVIGGSGQLGSAIARALLRGGIVAPESLWISNRSGTTTGFEDWPGVRFTIRNQDLVDACPVVILSVPPHLAGDMAISAPDHLVVSVMAGITIARMAADTGARRIVRAMSSPAADFGLAYSPWCANGAVSEGDRACVTSLFEACGLCDEVPNEDQIDRFTALTGPVPGFVAYYADCMVRHAVDRGIDQAIAERAIGQLFLASGTALAETQTSPQAQVAAMIEYAGTTAAGLEAMQASPLAQAIDAGLEAAYRKAQTIG